MDHCLLTTEKGIASRRSPASKKRTKAKEKEDGLVALLLKKVPDVGQKRQTNRITNRAGWRRRRLSLTKSCEITVNYLIRDKCRSDDFDQTRSSLYYAYIIPFEQE